MGGFSARQAVMSHDCLCTHLCIPSPTKGRAIVRCHRYIVMSFFFSESARLTIIRQQP